MEGRPGIFVGHVASVLRFPTDPHSGYGSQSCSAHTCSPKSNSAHLFTVMMESPAKVITLFRDQMLSANNHSAYLGARRDVVYYRSQSVHRTKLSEVIEVSYRFCGRNVDRIPLTLTLQCVGALHRLNAFQKMLLGSNRRCLRLLPARSRGCERVCWESAPKQG